MEMFKRKPSLKKEGKIMQRAASLLAAVAVAGGSAVVGMPQADAKRDDPGFYWEKSDEEGNLIGGSAWKIEFDWYRKIGSGENVFYDELVYYVVDGMGPDRIKELDLRDKKKAEQYLYENFGETRKNLKDKTEQMVHSSDLGEVRAENREVMVKIVPDVHPEPGKIATGVLTGLLDNRFSLSPEPPFRASNPVIEEVATPENYRSCGSDGATSASYMHDQYVFPSFDTASPKKVEPLEGKVLPLERSREEIVDEIKQVGDPVYTSRVPYWIVANFVNCKTPEPTTDTSTTTETPDPTTTTQEVPTTVVESETEPTTVPPVTVTETEKQEPTTVTTTPEKVTETVKVPSEETTVIVTEPGEPTTVTETPRDDKTAVVTISDTHVEDTPADDETSETVTVAESALQPSDTNTPRILASTGANVAGIVGIAGLLIGAAVFIVRRKK